MRRARLFFKLNAVAPADGAGFDDAAQQAAPPAKRFLKTLADFVHLMARRAWLRDFQQRLACSQPLPEGQFSESNPARRDVFPGAARRNPKFLERLRIHQQHLPAAPVPPVNAFEETLVFNGGYLTEFAHGFAMRQALKQVQNLRHAAPPPARSNGDRPWRRYRCGTARRQNEFCTWPRKLCESPAGGNRPRPLRRARARRSSRCHRPRASFPRGTQLRPATPPPRPIP